LEQQEVRDNVVIDVPSDKEDETRLHEIGSASQATVGPMDKFTKSLDASSLGKKIQPKTSEHIMKERLHKLKRYIARWLYVKVCDGSFSLPYIYSVQAFKVTSISSGF